jgi:hypothetical protein
MRRFSSLALLSVLTISVISGGATAGPAPPLVPNETLADIDGDGFDDLVVGVPEEDVQGQTDAGAMNVLFGGGAGLSSTGDQFWHQGVTGVIGQPEADDTFAASLALGDFDGDGFADVAAGIPGQTVNEVLDAGALIAFYGSSSGLTPAVQAWHQESPAIGGEIEAFDSFGSALAAGDFDGDGFDDLAVGSFGESVDPIEDAGAVNILYGSPAGLGDAGNQFWAQDVPGVLDQGETGDQFGFTLGSADFDGDGFDDLAVGCLGEAVGAGTGAGGVNLLYGGLGGLSTEGNQFWTQDSAGVLDAAENADAFSRSLVAEDFDGDGMDDLAVGAPGESVDAPAAGAVNVLFGAPGGLSSDLNQFWTQDSTGILDQGESDDGFGTAGTAGDFDLDGFADLVVGVPSENVGRVADAGIVQVLYGAATGLSSRDQVWSQNSAGIGGDAEVDDFFGLAVTANDYDGEGTDDLAVGVPNEDVDPDTDSGSVTVIYGNFGNGLQSAGSQFWAQDIPGIVDNGESFDRLGLSMA